MLQPQAEHQIRQGQLLRETNAKSQEQGMKSVRFLYVI